MAGCSTSSACSSIPTRSRSLDAEPSRNWSASKAETAYDEKEAEYPVLAGLFHFTSARRRRARSATTANSSWPGPGERFHVDLDVDDLRTSSATKSSDAGRAQPQGTSSRPTRRWPKCTQQVVQDLWRRSGGTNATVRTGQPAATARSTSLTDWLRERLDYELPPTNLAELDREELEQQAATARSKTASGPRSAAWSGLVLQLLDTAWKDHLLAMDHLRSSVGLRGYAQVDPKVEYKREGHADLRADVELASANA